MNLLDPKTAAAVFSSIVFLIIRWRWDYIVELYQQPKQAIKYLLIWSLLLMLVLRLLWQIKPIYFA